MSDNLASVLKDLFIFLTLALTVYNQLKTKAAVVRQTVVSEETKKAVEEVVLHTNSMKDALVKATSEAAFAKGVNVGKTEERDITSERSSP